MKPFIQDGHILALRAIRAVVGSESAARIVVEAIETRDWASATFVGKRHELAVRIEGDETVVCDAIARIERDLPGADVSATRFFLADIALGEYSVTLAGADSAAAIAVNALTIEG